LLVKSQLRKLGYDHAPQKAVNPIGWTFLSSQNMRKLRTIAEGCTSKFWLLRRLDRNVQPIGLAIFLRLSAKVWRLFANLPIMKIHYL
jgi:hypothetical protein